MISLLFLLLLYAGTGPKPWHVYCVYFLSLLCRAHYCLGHNPIVLYALLLSLGLLLCMCPYCILCINTGPCTPGDTSSLWLCPRQIVYFHSNIKFSLTVSQSALFITYAALLGYGPCPQQLNKTSTTLSASHYEYPFHLSSCWQRHRRAIVCAGASHALREVCNRPRRRRSTLSPLYPCALYYK
jgi:hypothetical protein